VSKRAAYYLKALFGLMRAECACAPQFGKKMGVANGFKSDEFGTLQD